MADALRSEGALLRAELSGLVLPDHCLQLIFCPAVPVVLYKDRTVRRGRRLRGGPEIQVSVRVFRENSVAADLVVLRPHVDGEIRREAVGRDDTGQFSRPRQIPVGIDDVRHSAHGLRVVAGDRALFPGADQSLQRRFSDGMLLRLCAREGPDAVSIVRGNDQDAVLFQKLLRRQDLRFSFPGQSPVKKDIVKAGSGGDLREAASGDPGFCDGSQHRIEFRRIPAEAFQFKVLRIRIQHRDLQPLSEEHPGQGAAAAACHQKGCALPEGIPLQQTFPPVGKDPQVLHRRIFSQQRRGIRPVALVKPFQFLCPFTHACLPGVPSVCPAGVSFTSTRDSMS